MSSQPQLESLRQIASTRELQQLGYSSSVLRARKMCTLLQGAQRLLSSTTRAIRASFKTGSESRIVIESILAAHLYLLAYYEVEMFYSSIRQEYRPSKRGSISSIYPLSRARWSTLHQPSFIAADSIVSDSERCKAEVLCDATFTLSPLLLARMIESERQFQCRVRISLPPLLPLKNYISYR